MPLIIIASHNSGYTYFLPIVLGTHRQSKQWVNIENLDDKEMNCYGDAGVKLSPNPNHRCRKSWTRSPKEAAKVKTLGIRL